MKWWNWPICWHHLLTGVVKADHDHSDQWGYWQNLTRRLEIFFIKKIIMIFFWFGGKGSLTESMNEWINDEGDCRTAPATPGLLMISLGHPHYFACIEKGRRLILGKIHLYETTPLFMTIYFESIMECLRIQDLGYAGCRIQPS